MSKDTSPAPIILVDGSSYLFRAYHGLPKLTSSKSHPTGAIRGVISMLRKLQQDYPKSKVIVIFDAKGKNFRHDMHPEYKANNLRLPLSQLSRLLSNELLSITTRKLLLNRQIMVRGWVDHSKRVRQITQTNHRDILPSPPSFQEK